MARKQAWTERDEIRARNWRFSQLNATIEYHERRSGTFLISALALPTVFAFAYLMIQVWAFTKTGIMHGAYAYPCIAIIGVFFLISAIIGKMNRPVDRY